MERAPGDTGQQSEEEWPALPWAAWGESCTTLHMWTQIAGKVKLRLAPWLNEWWQVALQLTARGLTTGPMRSGAGAFDLSFDFFRDRLEFRTSAGGARDLQLGPRSVADFYQEFMATLGELEIDVTINTLPDEVEQRIPFDQDREHAAYDAEYVRRWWRIILQTAGVLEEYRSPFVGKSSPVHLFWGGFDLTHTRFSGRPSTPPPHGSRMYRLAEDQENISCGFWPGAGKFAEPIFYSYTYPAPPGCETAPIGPPPASYCGDLGEWILGYEHVRTAADPATTLLEFFRSTYEAGAALAHWDRHALERPVPRL